jgi:hypothetical protein
MKTLLLIASLTLLTACGSGGPPPPDWKIDAADLIGRYQKHALRGENSLAERYFQQAVASTGGAGRVAETARLWLVRCATRRAMLIDDACVEYADLARLLAASLVVKRGEADDALLSLATETASAEGWKRPLLVYLKLAEKRASERQDEAALAAIQARIRLVEQPFSASP